MKHILFELFDKAQTEFYNNDLINAKIHFNKIIDIDSDFAPVYWYLGRINESQNKPDVASDFYRKYILYGLGEHNAGAYDSEIRIFNDLLLTMPNMHLFYEYRANAFRSLGQYSKSERDNISRLSFLNDKRTRDIFLFIDTETTGLPKKWDASISEMDNWPRMVQIAWILSDDKGNIIYEDDYIIKPDGFNIPIEASNIHKITNEKAMNYGASLKHILWRLIDSSIFVDYIVAHNLNFDFNVVGAEFLRCSIKNPFLNKKKICTMESTTNFCKIEGPYGYKWPKLSELNYKLFNKEIQDAHDASVDIRATFECFWQLKNKQII